MSELRSDSAQAMAEALRAANQAGNTIELGGRFSKRALGGPIAAPDVELSSAALNRLLDYEPADLTVSVEAGMPWRDLETCLAQNNQFIPLDPAYGDRATVGGVVASDSSGPRRRRYGTARDLVIGMEFATLEGKLVQSGGMVVKNVTGLDMAKPMIGSLGTLAAITRVNFRVYPRPETAATFLFSSDRAEGLLDLRNRILRGQAQPTALDLLNKQSLTALDLDSDAGYVLAAEAMGSSAVVARYRREYETLAADSACNLHVLDAERGEAFWTAVRQLAAVVTGEGRCWLRVSTVGTKLGDAIRTIGEDATLLVRAANGVVYAGAGADTARDLVTRLRDAGFVVLLEQGPDELKNSVEAWAAPGSDFEIMRRLKATFDPKNLLNPGRLYGKL